MLAETSTPVNPTSAYALKADIGQQLHTRHPATRKTAKTGIISDRRNGLRIFALPLRIDVPHSE